MLNFKKKYNAVTGIVATLFVLGCNNNTNQVVDTMEPQWSVQIVAEDTNNGLRFDNDRLGKVSVATNGVDSYDLKSMPRPFNGPHISVNFPQENQGYVTNFHSTETSESDEWIFTINSNPDRTVTLHWNVFSVSTNTDETGRTYFDQELSIDQNLVKRMQLVDAETNITLVSAYANGKLQNYTFNMDGETTRTFKWKLNSENVVEKVQEASVKYEPLYKAASMRVNALEVDNQIDITMPPRAMGK